MTFTIEQIKTAHSKVKSGADFPNYIQDLIKLGVIYYETFVEDGHTDFYGGNDYKIFSPPKYDSLAISERADASTFQSELKNHQQGKTDYPTFCKMCAETGIEKWTVDMRLLTCTYYDKSKNKILEEKIPQ